MARAVLPRGTAPGPPADQQAPEVLMRGELS